MDRRLFLSRLGAGAGVALAVTCLGSCMGGAEPDPSGVPVDFTLDLNQSPNLQSKGGFMVISNVLVARTVQGEYVAATVICSHEQQKKVVYDKAGNNFHCTAHDARFDVNGGGLNAKGSKNLTVYHTALSGSTLRVFSTSL
ncbi:hypothetical protein P872_19710 [Rhodonellum psychrophilum GCM71 = DSM 17998]|uniref:Rieske domain-containing protein n=2 Tax=Rhodonellum TaxID=336827 RepID=U5BVR2_9BACT|nr:MULTISPECIES: Rieske 2Fe-2S domain-containing protein [Rhodonellum]ERM81649.1 hypothetical protein P872_19710 [Rhodonellum psychrophilum GCM71 = DSM 17998]SDZ39352.1 Rieske [2Fe-2S] domain-containing protein [Rhodonellum ikkaensis]